MRVGAGPASSSEPALAKDRSVSALVRNGSCMSALRTSVGGPAVPCGELEGGSGEPACPAHPREGLHTCDVAVMPSLPDVKLGRGWPRGKPRVA